MTETLSQITQNDPVLRAVYRRTEISACVLNACETLLPCKAKVIQQSEKYRLNHLA